MARDHKLSIETLVQETSVETLEIIRVLLDNSHDVIFSTVAFREFLVTLYRELFEVIASCKLKQFDDYVRNGEKLW